MENKTLLYIFFLVVLNTAAILAQSNNSEKIVEPKADQPQVENERSVKKEAAIENGTGNVKTPQATGDEINFKDEDSNSLITITDEGTTGSVTIPAGSTPSATTNKLYNVGSTLFFNGSALGSGGASSINDLSDAKTDATSLFLGSGAGANDDGSNNNTAVGISALHSNTSGQDNTAIGHSALNSNTTGNSNTSAGGNALALNTSGSSNSTVGYDALGSNTIGNFNTANGYEALYSNIAGENGVAFGYQSQYYTNNTTTGFSNDNTSVGYQSLMGSTTPSSNTGNYNSAFGFKSLYSNSTGGNNLATGYYALNRNTTGYYNTASGYAALSNNTTGNNNTAIGYNALHANQTGNSNTAMGVAALLNNKGDNNTAIGETAFNINTTGSNNTAVGLGANVASGDLTNATAIGYNAVVSASNTIQLGDNNITAIYAKVTITHSSDSTKKENFLKVNGEKVLEKFRKFRLTSWNFKGDNPLTQRHYGIMAQDFYSAFGHDAMGTIGNDTTVNELDLNGINIIAIQALENGTKKRASRISELEKQNAELEMKNAAIANENTEIKIQDTELETQNAELKKEFESIKLILNKLASEKEKINISYK